MCCVDGLFLEEFEVLVSGEASGSIAAFWLTRCLALANSPQLAPFHESFLPHHESEKTIVTGN